MECIVCNGKTEHISKKVYPCRCGDFVEVNEYVCFSCGHSFEVVDGSIIGDPKDNVQELLSIIKSNGFDADEFGTFITNLGQELAVFDNSSMMSLTHVCLKCGAPSFDNGVGTISCSKCGFEWEVMSH